MLIRLLALLHQCSEVPSPKCASIFYLLGTVLLPYQPNLLIFLGRPQMLQASLQTAPTALLVSCSAKRNPAKRSYPSCSAGGYSGGSIGSSEPNLDQTSTVSRRNAVLHTGALVAGVHSHARTFFPLPVRSWIRWRMKAFFNLMKYSKETNSQNVVTGSAGSLLLSAPAHAKKVPSPAPGADEDIEAAEYVVPIRVVALRGSVPQAWVEDFGTATGKFGRLTLTQRVHIKDVFEELSDFRYSV